MSYIGLLMVSHEDDILEETLAANVPYLDSFYVLDGTVPNTVSYGICNSFPECRGYLTDAQLPRPPFADRPRCGYRKAIHDLAVSEQGPDHWFLVLHGDEIWTFDPRDPVAEHPDADGFVFRTPCYFPRAGEPWDYDLHPLQQLRWRIVPGWPEFRLFKGREGVAYDANQLFNTQPGGLTAVRQDSRMILHFPFRSPDHQRERAARHEKTGFDPDNYRQILDRDLVYWDDAWIEHYFESGCYTHAERV